MSLQNEAALDFLHTRRSRPAKTLVAPAPTRGELLPLLTAAARSPDHGKLEPWRFVVVEKNAMSRLAELTETCGQSLGKTEDEIAKARSQFEMGHLAVVVVEVQKPSEKVPTIEQTYSTGAVCLALLNAALAAGWGANWLSGWQSHNRRFLRGWTWAGQKRTYCRLYPYCDRGRNATRATPPECQRPHPMDFGMIIVQSFLQALGQIGDPRFRKVLVLGVGLAFALLVAANASFLWLLNMLVGEQVTLPILGEVTWLNDLLSVSSFLLMVVLSVFSDGADCLGHHLDVSE